MAGTPETGPGIQRPFTHKNPHRVEEFETKTQDGGTTSTGKKVTVHTPDADSVQHGARLTASLFDRKVSRLAYVKHQLHQVIQWLQEHILPARFSRPAHIKVLPRSFFPYGAATRRAIHAPAVKSFMNRNDYAHTLRNFMERIEELDVDMDILDQEAQALFAKLLKPETTTSITSRQTLAAALAEHGIKVGNTSLDDENFEDELVLNNEQLSALKEKTFFQAYQLVLLLEGLRTTLTKKVSQLADPDDPATAHQASLIKLWREDLPRLVDLTMGLCHASLKAEMPTLYNDDLYTALSIKDKKGRAHFRSDSIQPRGGWLDV